jgi:hypothetical protein
MKGFMSMATSNMVLSRTNSGCQRRSDSNNSSLHVEPKFPLRLFVEK